MKKNEIKWLDTEYCGSADETVQPVLVNGRVFYCLYDKRGYQYTASTTNVATNTFSPLSTNSTCIGAVRISSTSSPARVSRNSSTILKPKNSKEMKKKFNVAITLPLTLWVEVEAENDDEAIEKAREIALKTPYEEWGDDFSTAEADIVEE